MGEIIKEKVVEREKGFLYYIDKEGNLCKSKMSRKGRPRKEK